jgi:hypothetical protein
MTPIESLLAQLIAAQWKRRIVQAWIDGTIPPERALILLIDLGLIGLEVFDAP